VPQHAGRATEGVAVLDAAAAVVALTPYAQELMPQLLPYLSHASADIRQSVAATFAVARVRDASGPLRARLAVERDDSVRATTVRSLKLLDAER
jgi:hypothetical protein